VRGGAAEWIENLRELRALGPRFDRTLVATAGDRVALEGVSELELLLLTEVDAAGAIRAVIHFDPADRADAFAEMMTRALAGEAAGLAAPQVLARFRRAYDAHDFDAMRACLAPEFAFQDHRMLGLAPTSDRDHFIEWTRQFVELAPDLRAEVIAIPAMGPTCMLSVARVFGTQREGGAFEQVFAGVFECRDDRILRYDLFDAGDLAGARARYAEIETGRSAV
jgi:hypothetical protein